MSSTITYNEPAWRGDVVSEINLRIGGGTCRFAWAGGEGSLTARGQTLYPDIYLYTNKATGEIFHGWELKFPDTEPDDPSLVENAVRKAIRLRAHSFLTWNASAAILWEVSYPPQVPENQLNNLTPEQRLRMARPIHTYPASPQIRTRADVASQTDVWLRRLEEILRHLEDLWQRGRIRPGLRVSQVFHQAMVDVLQALRSPFAQAVAGHRASDSSFRRDFQDWWLVNRAVLPRSADPNTVLAERIIQRALYKIIFYRLLEGAAGRTLSLQELDIGTERSAQQGLEEFWSQIEAIDYRALFRPDFGDRLPWPGEADNVIRDFLEAIRSLSFAELPSETAGRIVEDLVAVDERKRLGLYSTPPRLADLIVGLCLETVNDFLFDPCCGTGTFLTSAYDFHRYFARSPEEAHSQILEKLWGNDLQALPAAVSLIALYQRSMRSPVNFPLVLSRNIFELAPGQSVEFPDPRTGEPRELQLPVFHAIVSNLPLVRQEDIRRVRPALVQSVHHQFGETQSAFRSRAGFRVNQRTDYFAYIFYWLFQFTRPGAKIGVNTSNAWLCTEYGEQLKQFLKDNFDVLAVIQSEAEEWFENSEVQTIAWVVRRKETGDDSGPKCNFVTLKHRLQNLIPEDPTERWQEIDRLRALIFGQEECQPTAEMRVRSYDQGDLYELSRIGLTWRGLFYDLDPLLELVPHLTRLESVARSWRGERTGWDRLFYPRDPIAAGIEPEFLRPVLMRSEELQSRIHFVGTPQRQAFACELSETELRRLHRHGALRWIDRFRSATNTRGDPLPEVLARQRRPYWYSLSPEKQAHIVLSMNPFERLFFSWLDEPAFTNQRLISIAARDAQNTRLLAALLNAVPTLLWLEQGGFPRALGALDINANYIKRKLHLVDPTRLSESAIRSILQAFAEVEDRQVRPLPEELRSEDRRRFDYTVLDAIGAAHLLEPLYNVLEALFRMRVELAATRRRR